MRCHGIRKLTGALKQLEPNFAKCLVGWAKVRAIETLTNARNLCFPK
jgi:hypothetical protein